MQAGFLWTGLVLERLCFSKAAGFYWFHDVILCFTVVYVKFSVNHIGRLDIRLKCSLKFE